MLYGVLMVMKKRSWKIVRFQGGMSCHSGDHVVMRDVKHIIWKKLKLQKLSYFRNNPSNFNNLIENSP